MLQLGEIRRPGTVDVKPGDSLSDVVDRAVKAGKILPIHWANVQSWKLHNKTSDTNAFDPRMKDLLPWWSDSILVLTLEPTALVAGQRQLPLRTLPAARARMRWPVLTCLMLTACVPVRVYTALSSRRR